jgi:L-iditol 2-dehydrogenase
MGSHGHGPDVVIEAVGLPETSEAAIRAVRKGGVVNLFAGCPADTRIMVDAQRLHYHQLTIRSTFHHTPESIRGAYRLIADGVVDPAAFITGQAPLEELPAVLARMAQGSDELKTAILTASGE